MNTLNCLVVLIAFALSLNHVTADDMRDEIREQLARPIQKALNEAKQTTLVIGDFSGPAQSKSSAGPGIAQLLAEELSKLNITISDEAPFSVMGKYLSVKAKDRDGKPNDFLSVKITAELIDSQGEVQVVVHTFIRNLEAISHLLGITASLPPSPSNSDESKDNLKARSDSLDRQFQEPNVFTNGTQVKAKVTSPFAVELLVQTTLSAPMIARKAEIQGGKAYVPLAKTELYAIRISNTSSQEAVASITIDGLDVFTFSESINPDTGEKYKRYIVPPATKQGPGAVTVIGWHLRDHGNLNYSRFVVTEYGKGAAAKAIATPKSEKPGVITVVISPSYLVRMQVMNVPKTTDLGTGRGPEVRQETQHVRREVGEVIETISIRYSKDSK